MATVAEVVGLEMPQDAAEDSFSMWPAMHQSVEEPIRPYLLTQGARGKRSLGIRQGHWKYLDHQGSGGNNYDTHPQLKEYRLPEMASDAPGQLYNMEQDPGETKNLANSHPEVVTELKSLLQESITRGRSR